MSRSRNGHSNGVALLFENPFTLFEKIKKLEHYNVRKFSYCSVLFFVLF